jgi:adenine-specific DNA-methyltransferase
MLQNGQFDYVCSNPPYLGEKGNQKVFRQVLDALPYWKQFYQGKMDYFYWFIILGLSKLRQGGRLVYVTTGYWHTADGASVLRRYILDHAKIVEMIDFGPVRPFPDAQGQHTMVFVLERCDDEQQRRGHRPKLVQVRQQGHCLDTLLDHIQVKLDAPVGESYEDDCIRVFWSPVLQNELSESAWHIFQDHETAAVLRQLAGAGEALGRVCEYVQGVVSGADRVTRAHFRHLAPEVVDQHGIHEGDGIFVLSAEELASLSLSDHERTLVKRTYKNSQVARYLVDADGDPPEFLLYVAPGCGFSPSATPALYTHLEKYRGILQKKRECHLIDQRTGQPYRQWFELHWPRDERALCGEKIVAPRRAAENRFALAGGDVYENSDLAVLVKRPGVREGLKYLLALLNSAALDFWCAHRCKRKGKIREYYRTPLQEVPIRRIRFEPATAEGLKRAAIGQLRADLDSERYDTALARLRCALDAAQEDVVHDGLELLVDRMIHLTARLATENARFGLGLPRLRADAPLPPTVPAAMLESSPVPEIRRAMSQTQSIIDSVVWSLYDIPSPTPQSTNP